MFVAKKKAGKKAKNSKAVKKGPGKSSKKKVAPSFGSVSKAKGKSGAASVREIIKRLHELYPEADCELRHSNAHELLFATIMSAQSTDKMVNKVTEDLFEKYLTVQDYVNADPEEFQVDIKSTGFFRNKTKAVLGAAKKIVEDYGGEVPDTMEEQIKLPGVARKTANVVLGTWFKKPTGVVVDTHVKRLAGRIGLSQQTNPDKIELDLMELLPEDEWIFMGHSLIWHGRRICDAKKPLCSECKLESVCEKNGVE